MRYQLLLGTLNLASNYAQGSGSQVRGLGLHRPLEPLLSAHPFGHAVQLRRQRQRYPVKQPLCSPAAEEIAELAGPGDLDVDL